MASDSTQVHELLDPLYYFSKYEELHRAYIRTEENIPTTFDFAAGQFNAALQVDYIAGANQSIRFRQFMLNESVRDNSCLFLRPVYLSSGEVEENEKQIFVAVKHQQTGKTLIIAVTAHRI